MKTSNVTKSYLLWPTDKIEGGKQKTITLYSSGCYGITKVLARNSPLNTNVEVNVAYTTHGASFINAQGSLISGWNVTGANKIRIEIKFLEGYIGTITLSGYGIDNIIHDTVFQTTISEFYPAVSIDPISFNCPNVGSFTHQAKISISECDQLRISWPTGKAAVTVNSISINNHSFFPMPNETIIETPKAIWGRVYDMTIKASSTHDYTEARTITIRFIAVKGEQQNQAEIQLSKS